ncbi:glycerate kinase [Allopusillimonas soli]|uniref:Glycerate kinase n=1 Tax=Allopusillimonas soli TaxID=659016 RepID=A0A853FAY3_9BURK|nr:glycerate kinase [Allopusillimonas soli]NYT36782.1 glycerate kinase [Allopusillimonas soli]TEA75629.1 glycerate kinase [Allopusillimonas soli]
MRVLVAPDSFKESLSAQGVADAIAAGVRDAAPDAQIRCVPMADGGEGSLGAVLAATSGQLRQTQVQDANGQPCDAAWAWLGEGKAFIEMAQAAGLERIPENERRPLLATSHGVGELIGAAVAAGARHIVMGLGGSATNDAGAGLLQALGVKLVDASGVPLPPGGAALSDLAHIDASGIDPCLREVQFEIAVDVDNPLCGPRGASAIFGPQKGADDKDIATLDAALSHFADICAQQFGVDERDAPGMGAAGGLGFGVKACFNARFRPGVELIADLLGLAQAMRGMDLVFTGEGRMDAQSAGGKTPVGVARLARRQGIPVFAIAGSLGQGYEAVYDEGISAAFSLTPGPVTLAQACDKAAHYLRQRARDCMLAWMAGRRS